MLNLKYYSLEQKGRVDLKKNRTFKKGIYLHIYLHCMYVCMYVCIIDPSVYLWLVVDGYRFFNSRYRYLANIYLYVIQLITIIVHAIIYLF